MATLQPNYRNNYFLMDLALLQNSSALEDRLFKNALFIGFLIVILLIGFDAFVNKDFVSVTLELLTGLFIMVNYLMLKNRPASARQRYTFSIILVIVVNLGWMVGGGISILLTSIYFLVLGFILMINDSKYYKLIFALFCINYVFLFCIEYFFKFNLSPTYYPNKADLIKNYIITLVYYFFGGYFIVFLKLNYNKERMSLQEANKLMSQQSSEISSQNEELRTSKEILDDTIKTMEVQHKELNEIKELLEIKVQERTNDLLKVNERLVAQNQQLEQYTYITSHNLRAPIAQIKGLVKLLPESGKFDAMTAETLKRLNESANNLDKVFSDLSRIIRVEKEMQQPWETIDIVDELLEVISSLKNSIIEKDIKILHPDLNEIFQIKSLKPYVYSVFHNIIENAVKYSDPKKDNSFIKIQLGDTEKYHIVSIIDNGIGIDMGVASNKIFKMYQRFNDTHPGQGFGLFLVKSQMEALGGKVELESILGQGTTFNLYFAKR